VTGARAPRLVVVVPKLALAHLLLIPPMVAILALVLTKPSSAILGIAQLIAIRMNGVIGARAQRNAAVAVDTAVAR
jgi:hypothetical protein